MQFEVHALRSRASLTLALCAWLCGACSGGDEPGVVNVRTPPDAGEAEEMPPDDEPKVPPGCVDVQIDGDAVVEKLQDFTARFEVGTPYTKTLMLFGGMAVLQPNTPSRAYIFGLDKVDAQKMAMKYPDFYLCSSPGGQEASEYIQVYDIVPANCKIHEQLLAALRVLAANAAKGGDRTSLRMEGKPLTVKSITDDVSGQDVSAQVSGQQFHLITAVQRLTGESLLDFGTTD
jgi:hypothetical protein